MTAIRLFFAVVVVILNQDVQACTDQWKMWRNSCYLFAIPPHGPNYNRDGMDWRDARVHCRRNGADLVSITSDGEVDFVYNFTRNYNWKFWIGLNRQIQQNAGWSWSNGDKLNARKWRRGEPSSKSGHNCAELLRKSREWNSQECHRERAWICEKRNKPSTAIPKPRPPVRLTVTSRTAFSLSFSWIAPDHSKRDDTNVSYSLCLAHSRRGPCFKKYSTTQTTLVVRNLNASTKYFVRFQVTSRTKTASSTSVVIQEFFTEAKPLNVATPSPTRSSTESAQSTNRMTQRSTKDQPSKAKSSSNGSMKTALFIFLPLILLALLIVIVLLVRKKRKSRGKESAIQGNRNQQENPNPNVIDEVYTDLHRDREPENIYSSLNIYEYPDRPYVIGNVENSKNKPAITKPQKEQNLSYVDVFPNFSTSSSL